MNRRIERGGSVSLVLDAVAIFVLTAVLIWPLFQVAYLDNWGSIDSIFIAHARFLVENWPHPLWQPLWYGGTRFDYLYPPALPYGTAALSMLFSVPLARSYHLYTAFYYCLGMAGIYIFVRVVSGSRGMAWLAAIASVLVSPSFALLEDVYIDAHGRYLLPQRLNALVQWGEGPHMSALAVVPLALAASFLAFRDRSRGWLAAAAMLSALLVANNFYGGTALALMFPALVWACWVTHRDYTIWGRAAAIAVLAYGLTAFWLVPSYVRVTQENLSLVGAGSNPRHVAWAALGGFVFLAITYLVGRGRPERCYGIFVAAVALAFSIAVAGDTWFGWKVVGSTNRMVPELDLALILAGFALARWLWNRAAAWPSPRAWLVRAPVAILAIAPLMYALPYLRNAWNLYPADDSYQQRVEFRMSRWMDDHMPDARSYVDGSLRFWYDAWFSLPQIGGGSDQGLLNHQILPIFFEVRSGDHAQDSIDWLRALGVSAIVVHDNTSQEVFHDFQNPRKFQGVLPVIYDEGKGDVIYEVPRRYPGLARVVSKAAIENVGPIREGADIENVRVYVDAVENGPESPVTFQWEGPNAMRIGAELAPGELLLVQVAYDPNWRAYARGRRLVIREDPLGQMLVEALPDRQQIELVFPMPIENQVGWLLFAISLAAVVVLLITTARQLPPASPAGVSRPAADSG